MLNITVLSPSYNEMLVQNAKIQIQTELIKNALRKDAYTHAEKKRIKVMSKISVSVPLNLFGHNEIT